MGNIEPSFGSRLKQLRKVCGYRTQQDLADALGNSLDTVRNWEQNKTFPQMADFLSLCDFFACDADYLLGRMERRTHELDVLCAGLGLTVEAVASLRAIGAGTMGGEDLDIASTILASPRFAGLIKSIKDAKWAAEDIAGDFDDLARGNAIQSREDADYYLSKFQNELRFLKATRYEVTEAAVTVLNEFAAVDGTISDVEKGLEDIRRRWGDRE